MDAPGLQVPALDFELLDSAPERALVQQYLAGFNVARHPDNSDGHRDGEQKVNGWSHGGMCHGEGTVA